MHKILRSRIKTQRQSLPPLQTLATFNLPPVDNPPISREELKVLLMDALKEPEPVIDAEPVKYFPHLWSFVEWYEPIKTQFTEQQRTALDTLLQTRDMVEKGCPCRRQSREQAANEYFKTFWLNNQENDLIPTVLKISGKQQIKFAYFLTFPATL